VVAALPIGTVQMDQLLELLAFLVSRNPESIRTQDSTNQSLAMHVACRTCAPIQVLQFLANQDPVLLYYVDASGCLPLHEACRAGAPLETLQFLVKASGAGTVCALNHNGALPLHLLCRAHPEVAVIKYLLESYPKSASIKNDGDCQS